MATKQIFIGGIFSSGSDLVFPGPASLDHTGVTDPEVYYFEDGSTDAPLNLELPVPGDYAGAPKVRVRIRGVTTTGDIRLGFRYSTVANAEDGDPNSWTETVVQTVTIPSTSLEEEHVTFTLTAGNLSADDRLPAQIFRQLSNAADDYGDRFLLSMGTIELEYSDT